MAWRCLEEQRVLHALQGRSAPPMLVVPTATFVLVTAMLFHALPIFAAHLFVALLIFPAPVFLPMATVFLAVPTFVFPVAALVFPALMAFAGALHVFTTPGFPALMLVALFPAPVVVAVPVSGFETPVAIAAIPAFGHPDVAGAFLDPASSDPDVGMTIPAPVAGVPHMTVTRRGQGFVPGRRRGFAQHDGDADVNIDIDAGLGRAKGEKAEQDPSCQRVFRLHVYLSWGAVEPARRIIPPRRKGSTVRRLGGRDLSRRSVLCAGVWKESSPAGASHPIIRDRSSPAFPP